MGRPSPTTLRTFAVAGRLQSFRDAAEELHVTPSAVSHQVRTLEEWVGADLFVRSTRRVELTPVGAALADALGKAFTQVDRALDRAREESTDQRLRVSALPLFTNTWLAPRLSGFEEQWPGLSIRVETVNDIVDVAGGQADVGIRNAPASQAGLVRRRLIVLEAVPLCTPELAARVHAPADLAGLTLIEHSARPDGWTQWFRAMGLASVRPGRTISMDSLPSAISAAAKGAGVVLGLAPFIWDAPGVEAMVNPVEGPLVRAGDYSVVYRKRDANRRVVRAFVDWLFAEMKADVHRLRALPRKAVAGPALPPTRAPRQLSTGRPGYD